MNDDPRDLLNDLMSWSLPPGTRERMAQLDDLWARTCLLCGADKVVHLPKEPNLLREKLIDVVEDYLDRRGL